MPRLEGEYYAACNEVFRRATNQGERMVAAVVAAVAARPPQSILSVGSGTGLFEIPLLEQLSLVGSGPHRFVGLDPNAAACRELSRKLAAEFDRRLHWEVLPQPFQTYRTEQRFDVVLFSHAFEYLPGEPLTWIRRARNLLTGEGSLLIISPEAGGINKIYAEQAEGFRPVFSQDLHQALDHGSLGYSVSPIQAECDLSLLEGPERSPEAICLLSFLTQLDCRRLSASAQQQFIDYYLSLRPAGNRTIPHPASLFVLQPGRA